MIIHGLQKMTLLDYPGKVACIVFFGGCNFRCPYCHNSELLDGSAPPVMKDDELLAFLKKRQGLLEGVVITGGEPLLQPDLADLMVRIKELGYPIKLDTNGSFPERLKALVEAGLVDYVAMDVKSSPEGYMAASGIAKPDMEAIRESVAFLLSGAVDYEFRTTLVEELHGEADIRAIAEWIKGARRYFLQPFADRDTVVFAGLHAPSKEKLQAYAEIMGSAVQEVQIRGLD